MIKKKSLPRLQSRGGKTYGNFAQNIKKKKKTENSKIDGETTENAEIYAKDTKASKSSERMQKGSFILQNIIN